MSTIPPEQPTQTSSTTGERAGAGGGRSGDLLATVPGFANPELVVFLLAWLVIAIIWAASDEVGANTFVTLTAVLTFGYLVSRGIAKASRVFER